MNALVEGACWLIHYLLYLLSVLFFFTNENHCKPSEWTWNCFMIPLFFLYCREVLMLISLRSLLSLFLMLTSRFPGMVFQYDRKEKEWFIFFQHRLHLWLIHLKVPKGKFLTSICLFPMLSYPRLKNVTCGILVGKTVMKFSQSAMCQHRLCEK